MWWWLANKKGHFFLRSVLNCPHLGKRIHVFVDGDENLRCHMPQNSHPLICIYSIVFLCLILYVLVAMDS